MTNPVDLDVLETGGLVTIVHALPSIIAELRALRALKVRVDAAPTGELYELGTDNGQPCVVISLTADGVRQAGQTLFQRVALVAVGPT